jgi:hypothetical protein
LFRLDGDLACLGIGDFGQLHAQNPVSNSAWTLSALTVRGSGIIRSNVP